MKNKELRARRHRKEQRIKELIAEAKAGKKPSEAKAKKVAAPKAAEEKPKKAAPKPRKKKEDSAEPTAE